MILTAFVFFLQPASETRLVAVRTRAQFRDRPEATPRKAYVLPGDLLVAEETRGGFTSVTFVDRRGKPSSGWIETAALRSVPTPAPTRAGWTGHWSYGDAEIEITPGKARGSLHVAGNATWGGHDPERVRTGGIHIGDFDGEVRPSGDRLSYADGYGICTVRMRLLGPYLLVEDNGECGGANVRFTGTYRR